MDKSVCKKHGECGCFESFTMGGAEASSLFSLVAHRGAAKRGGGDKLSPSPLDVNFCMHEMHVGAWLSLGPHAESAFVELRRPGSSVELSPK